ncbi:MAG: DUF362 domain-containing protein [Promethearchaeota archaeon]
MVKKSVVFGTKCVDEPDDIRDAVFSLIESLKIDSSLEVLSSALIKPNIVIAEIYTGGNTTHPGVVREIYNYLLEVNDRMRITIGDGGVNRNTHPAFEINGLTSMFNTTGMDLVDMNGDQSREIRIKGAKSLTGHVKIAQSALTPACIISVPSLKTHSLATTTLSMKNFMGVLKKKSAMHVNLHEKIVDLYSYFKNKAIFSIIDGIYGSDGFELGGDPINHEVLLASKDSVALDTVGSLLMKADLETCRYLSIAEKRELGNSSLKYIDLKGLDIEKDAIQYKRA